MTKSVSIVKRYVAGSEVHVLARVDITSYTSGGEGLSPSDVQLQRFETVAPLGVTDSSGVGPMALHWDEANEQLEAYDLDDGAEAGSAEDVGEGWILAIGT